MRAPRLVASVLLLLALLLMLAVSSTTFVYIEAAYATSGGSGDDDDDGGGDDFNFSKFQDDTSNELHILELKKGQRKYTEADLKAAVESRDKGITVVIAGAGKGFEDGVLYLAEFNANAAAKLLTRWSRLRAGNLWGMLGIVQRMLKSAKADLKKAEFIKAKSGGVIDNTQKFKSTIEMLEAFEKRIKGKMPVRSDVRLKKGVTYIATLESGIRLYSFQYLWDDKVYVGVMAQDLLSNSATRKAVSSTSDGYYAVDYEMLGLRMTTLEAWRAQGLASVQIEAVPGQISSTAVARTPKDMFADQ